MSGLALLFAGVAAAYASVGFGGGSSYLALLVIWGVPTASVPVVALACNLGVVSLNCLAHLRFGEVPWRLVLLPGLASVPAAYAGGRLMLPEAMFLTLLAVSLTLAGAGLLWRSRVLALVKPTRLSGPAMLAIGGALGLLAGVVGIGGGIFLSPLLAHLRAAGPRAIAAAASFFILVNSLAGLAGQLSKPGADAALDLAAPLCLAVLAGGMAGNMLLHRLLPARAVVNLTGVLVLFVAVRLWGEVMA